MKNHYLIFFFLVVSFNIYGQGKNIIILPNNTLRLEAISLENKQKKMLSLTDRKKDSPAYIDAIAIYESLAQKGFKNEEMFRKLGNAYYFNSELYKATKWYEELFIMNKKQDLEYYYRYSQCLKTVGNYIKASKIIKEFNKKIANSDKLNHDSTSVNFEPFYKFYEIKKSIIKQVLQGIVTDKETSLILADSKVSLYDEKFQIIQEYISDNKGHYTFQVDYGKTYYVRVEKNEYQTKEVSVTIEKVTDEIDLFFALEQRKKSISVGTDLAKILDIPIVYFDESYVRKDNHFVLGYIVALMKENPNIYINIHPHMLSCQKYLDNESLSARRVKSTIAWLIKHGIESSRLTSKGYKETQLANKCMYGISCSEEEQTNMQSEFIIISM
jgi:tetratricopeptide (TPR) repeat protein